MKTSLYWARRQAKQKVNLQNKTMLDLQQKLEKMYRTSANEVTAEIVNLFLTIVSSNNGEILMSDLYKYNRLYDLRKNMNNILTALGVNQLRAMGSSAERLYKNIAKLTLSDTEFYNKPKDLSKLINQMWDYDGLDWSERVWCKDGKNVSQRTALQMQKLQLTVEKGLTDCLAKGSSKDKLVETLQKRFEVAFHEADRMARTELTVVQNQASLDSYRVAGVEKYKYIAVIDSRTSELCRDLNSLTFKLAEAEIGKNLPPGHVNCRCTTIPVIEGYNDL